MPWNDRFGFDSAPSQPRGGRDRSLLREAVMPPPLQQQMQAPVPVLPRAHHHGGGWGDEEAVGALRGDEGRRHVPMIKPFVGKNGEHIKAVINTRAPPPKLAKKLRPHRGNSLLPGQQQQPHAIRHHGVNRDGDAPRVAGSEIEDDYEPYRRVIERLRQQGGAASEVDLAAGGRDLPAAGASIQRSSVSQHGVPRAPVVREYSDVPLDSRPTATGTAPPATANAFSALTLDVEKLSERRKSRTRSREALGSSITVDVREMDDVGSVSYDGEGSLSLDDSAAIKDLRMFTTSQHGADASRSKSSGAEGDSFPVCRLNVIGRGSSSVVYRSVVLPELAVVAEKVITVAEKEKRHQLVRELRQLRGLLHEGGALCPAVVQLVNVVPHPREGTVSVCLELMDGGSLQDVVRAGGCRDEAVLSRIAFQVLCGLDFLHSRRQVHRDIKPGNILVGMSGRVTISDFGISKELQTGQSLADTFVGTYNYMSPERISGQSYSFSSDIWSFGLVILACALGRYPYATQLGYWALLNAIQQQPAPELPPRGNGSSSGGGFPQPLCDLVVAALNKDVAARSSAAELLRHEAFDSIRAGELSLEPHDNLPYDIDDETIVNWDLCRSSRVLRPIENWLLQNPLQPAQVVVTKQTRGHIDPSSPQGKIKSVSGDWFTLANLPFPLSIPFVRELGVALRQQLGSHMPAPSWAPDSAAAWLDLRPFHIPLDAASVNALAAKLQVVPEVLQEVFISALRFARGGDGASLELSRAAIVLAAAAASPDASMPSPHLVEPAVLKSKPGFKSSLPKGTNAKVGVATDVRALRAKDANKYAHATITKPRVTKDVVEPKFIGSTKGATNLSKKTIDSRSVARPPGGPSLITSSKVKGGAENPKSKPKSVGLDLSDEELDAIIASPPKRVRVKTPRAPIDAVRPHLQEDDDEEEEYGDEDFAEEEKEENGYGSDAPDDVPEEEEHVPAPLARMQVGARALAADELAVAGVQHYRSPRKPPPSSGSTPKRRSSPHPKSLSSPQAYGDDFDEEDAGAEYAAEDGLYTPPQEVVAGRDNDEEEGEAGDGEGEEEELFPSGMYLDDLPFIDDTLTFMQEGKGGENLFSPPPPAAGVAASNTARPGITEDEEEYEGDFDLYEESVVATAARGITAQNNSEPQNNTKGRIGEGEGSRRDGVEDEEEQEEEEEEEDYGADEDFLLDSPARPSAQPLRTQPVAPAQAVVVGRGAEVGADTGDLYDSIFDSDDDKDDNHDRVDEQQHKNEKEKEAHPMRHGSDPPGSSAYDDIYADDEYDDEYADEEGDGAGGDEKAEAGRADSAHPREDQKEDMYGDDDFFN